MQRIRRFGYWILLWSFIMTISSTEIPASSPLESKKITIDPGHGGSASGAVGVAGMKEKDLNLKVAQDLKNLLENEGAIVRLTLDEDKDVSLQDRVIFHKQWDADLFVSIHHNANAEVDRSINRSEVYYQYVERDGPSRDLAYDLARQLERNLGFPGSEAKVTFAYYVLRKNSYPAILAEAAYLSNPEAEIYFQDPAKIQAEAKAYFEAIRNFFADGYPELSWEPVYLNGQPHDPEGPFEECPVFTAKIQDDRQGVDPSRIQAFIDGQSVIHHFSSQTRLLSITSPLPLPSGEHLIRVTAQNIAGRHGHALERQFSIQSKPAALLLDVEPESVPLDPSSIVRVKAVILDKNGFPIPENTSIDLKVEGGKIIRKEENLKEGLQYFYIRPILNNLEITASAFELKAERQLSTSDGIAQYCGWILDANTKLPIDTSSLPGGDCNGWFSWITADTQRVWNFNLPGYWPKSQQVNLVLGESIEDSLSLTPLFGGALLGKSIVLDPEFGGMESGQIGPTGLQAADVNLETARITHQMLEAAGAKVELTREDDRTMSDVDRVRFGLDRDFDWFITLRHAEPRPGENEPPDLNISRAYAKWSDAEQMARVFPKYMQELMGTDGADTKNCSTWEVMHASNKFQAIGLSPLFMTAPGAEKRLSHSATLRKEAQSVLFGLIEYFTFQNDEGLLPAPPDNSPSYQEQLSERTAFLSGLVTDLKTGKPLADVLIGIESLLWTGTENDGKFLWHYLDPGTYQLSFSKPGYTNQTIEINLQKGERKEIQVQMEK